MLPSPADHSGEVTWTGSPQPFSTASAAPTMREPLLRARWRSRMKASSIKTFSMLHDPDRVGGELHRADVGIMPEGLAEAPRRSGASNPPRLTNPLRGLGDDAVLADLLPPVEDDALARIDVPVTSAVLVRGLDPRNRHLIFLRFHEDLDQADIGARLRTTGASVSRN